MFENRNLFYTLLKKEIAGKYKGTMLGGFWSVLKPLVMLSIFYLVFGEIFKVRWSNGASTANDFAFLMFIGLLLFNFFSEIIVQAPHLVVANSNYVKKVVFPLEILIGVSVSLALFELIISILVWCLLYSIFITSLHWTVLCLPAIIIPLLLFSSGVAFVFAALGAYFKDMAQTVGLAVTALMFLSPIFYPFYSLAPDLQDVIIYNPLTIPITAIRDVMFWGNPPDYSLLFFYAIASISVFSFGIWFFKNVKEGFADVI